jgi:hypothetical protein
VVAKSVLEGGEKGLVFGKVIGGFPEILRKSSKFGALGRFHDHGISCRAGVAPGSAVDMHENVRGFGHAGRNSKPEIRNSKPEIRNSKIERRRSKPESRIKGI